MSEQTGIKLYWLGDKWTLLLQRPHDWGGVQHIVQHCDHLMCLLLSVGLALPRSLSPVRWVAGGAWTTWQPWVKKLWNTSREEMPVLISSLGSLWWWRCRKKKKAKGAKNSHAATAKIGLRASVAICPKPRFSLNISGGACFICRKHSAGKNKRNPLLRRCEGKRFFSLLPAQNADSKGRA